MFAGAATDAFLLRGGPAVPLGAIAVILALVTAAYLVTLRPAPRSA